MAGHLHAPSSLLTDPLPKLAGIGGVSPDDSQPRQFPLQLVGQELSTAVAVVQAGRVDVHAKHETSGVHQEMALTPGDALGAVVATLWTDDTGGPHNLAV
jgi:hypothetical protein